MVKPNGETANAAIRTLIADDQQAIRSGLRAMLTGTEIEIVREASSGNEAIEAVQDTSLDVVILDIRMPDGDGLFALRQIKETKPDLPCLMLTTYDNASYIERSRNLGAAGYLLKGTSREQIVDSIRLVASGHNLWFYGTN